MSQPISKTDTVRQLVAARRYKDALRIVKTFRLGLTKEQQVTFGRAYESYAWRRRKCERWRCSCRM